MNTSAFLQKSGSIVRWVLAAAIAVVLGLIVTTPKSQYPQIMSRAQAEGICAAPGYLMTSMNSTQADRFYLVDTTRQVICIYTVTGDQLRLQAARKYDYDVGIPDGSFPVMVNGKMVHIESGNGVTREEAKGAGEAIIKMIEDGKKKQ